MKIIDARKYEIIPNTESCQIENFQRMLREHPSDTRFVLEPGSYHFWGENALHRHFAVSNSDQAEELNIALLLEHMDHVEIDGQGAEFLFHGDLCPAVVTDCEGIRMKDFSIDFPIPSSAEAEILHAEEHAVEIYLNHRQYPYHVEEEILIFEREYGQESPLFAAMEFDRGTGRIPEGAGDTFPRVKAREVKEDVVRLEGEFSVVPKAGNFLVLRHGKRVHPGMLLQHSKDILMDGITFYQTGGLGAVFQFCQDIHVNRVAFRANEKRGRRILSGHDDGLHFSNNKGSILVENSYFHGLMDDPINVHGTAVCLVKCEGGGKLRGAFRHHQSKGFSRWADKGDEISFINPVNRADCARGVVKEYRLLSEDEFELVLEKDIPSNIQEGYALENLTYTPSVTLRKNFFGSCRARGVLITTPKPVRIEENIFESSGAAILLAGDVNDWYESGTCTDVLIRNNQFRECSTSMYQFCNGVIDIDPSVKEAQKGIVHHHIRIEDNQFQMASSTLLFADHAGDIRIQNNHVETGGRPLEISLNWCEDVAWEENELEQGTIFVRKELPTI